MPHQIDHIIAQQHRDSHQESNLCLCCLRCNLKKGPNIASTDPEDRGEYRLVALFHPRQQRWQEHFQLREDGRLEGLTPEGRATARLLDFNAEERVQLRRLLMRHGWRPYILPATVRDVEFFDHTAVYGWCTEGFNTADLQEAKALLEELGA